MLAVVLLLASALARAETLGEIEVRSAVGEPLDATIALGASAAGTIGPECIFVSRGASEDGPFVTRAVVAVFDADGARYLRLKTAGRIDDRATRLRVVVRCPGQPHVAYREYRDLFDPRPQPAPRAAAPSAIGAPPSLGAFPVRPGDTMDSLAALLFPRNRAAQRAYVDAMRERNPALAALGGADPLPVDAAVELPDLRSIPTRSALAESRPPRKAARKPAIAPAPALARTPAIAPVPKATPAPPKLAAPKAAPEPRKPASAPLPRARSEAQAERFTLRLSSPEIDLSRSRGLDDSARARLRERLMVLDNDDQVAALLALRDSVKRLEGRVADLQLKLSGIPAVLSAMPPKAETPPPRVEPPPAKVEPPPAKVEAPPAKVEPPPEKIEAQPPKAEPPSIVAVPVAPKPAIAPKPAPARPASSPAAETSGLPAWLWGVVALLVVLAMVLLVRSLRRAHEEPSEEALPEIAPVTAVRAGDEPQVPDLRRLDIDVDEPVAVAVPTVSRRREIGSDAGLATEVRGSDPATLRRRYIEERFPEIANRTIVLSDPDSLVKAARLFYEDGAVSRAVELLQFATEETPAEQRSWLALFEIYRLERLTGAFADLAQRFRDAHGKDENWRKVQYFGREIDPGNALYRDLAVGIETIKFEVGKPPPAVSFDPVAENWLNAPMDFENEVLVIELRRALMVQAGLTEEDLAPNPMPALRSVEMFTVA